MFLMYLGIASSLPLFKAKYTKVILSLELVACQKVKEKKKNFIYPVGSSVVCCSYHLRVYELCHTCNMLIFFAENLTLPSYSFGDALLLLNEPVGNIEDI